MSQLRIAFVCGSLEKGVDGVGDYVLKIGSSLARQGLGVICIALHDEYVLAGKSLDFQSCSILGLDCVRVSSNTTWARRIAILQNLFSSWQPDWISLQYVPYSFSSKGLPWRFLSCLRADFHSAKWHLMAHELWVDPDKGLKNRLLAMCQKVLFRALLIAIKPCLVHTSNSYYLHLLLSIGADASVLPLFSNIPFYSGLTSDCYRQYAPLQQVWSLVFFGTIHAEWDPFSLLSALLREAMNFGVTTISFTSIGNAGSYGSQLWQELASTMPQKMQFHRLGPLPPCDISLHLQQADWGVTTTPSHLLGKSGSVAAMLAHGLPVIVPRLEKTDGPWHQDLLADERFILLDSNFSARLHQRSPEIHNPRSEPDEQLVATTDQLLLELSAAT